MEDLFMPVLESATVLAAHYAKACGRDTVTGQDMHIGLMYAARNVAGKQVGSLFPEIYDDDDEEEEEDELEEVDEDEEPFTRYTGDEELYVKMNECFDTWDEWTPETPLEQTLKNAVERAREAFIVPE
jgi:hypothetical protein